MKMNMTQMPKYGMARRVENMLRAAWRILRQVPYIRMVRADSPSQRAVVTDFDPMPLWSGRLACAGVFQ